MVDEFENKENEVALTEEELAEEVKELKEDLTERRSGATTRIRGAFSIVLVLLAAISLTFAGISWWVSSILLDTEAFMEVVEPAITSEEFTDALGDRLSEEAIKALDLETRFEERLSDIDRYIGEQLVTALDPDPRVIELLSNLDPPRFADLAGPLSSAANDRITEAITNLVGSEAYQVVTVAAIEKMHESALALITDDLESLDNVYIAGDEVLWNAIPLVVGLLEFVIEDGLLDGEEITLPDLSDNPVATVMLSRLKDVLGPHVPDDLGQVTLMTTSELDSLQTYGVALGRSLWIIIGLAVVLTVTTLVVSPRRSRTAIQLAVGTVVALVLAILGVNRIFESIHQGIVEDQNFEAAISILSHLEASVQAVASTIILIAVMVGILSWFAGRPDQLRRWLDAGRLPVAGGSPRNRVDSFVGRFFDGLAIAVILVGLAIAWVTTPTWFWSLILIALVGAFIWYGLSARARYELHHAVEEIEEETAGSTAD